MTGSDGLPRRPWRPAAMCRPAGDGWPGRRRWRPGAVDERGSLPLALLLTLVAVLVSALLLPMVLGQFQATRGDIRQVNAADAAQAGLDVALAHLRAAGDATGAGVPSALPCGPFTGAVGVGGTARYQVTVDYLATDPAGLSDAWVGANRMACSPGSGPSGVPQFALLRAEGTDAATGAFGTVPGRSLRATYRFQFSNVNVTGGAVHVYSTGAGTDLCLDAGSGTAPAGTSLRVEACVTGSAGQRFAYHSNLAMVLVASQTAALPLGLCLDAGAPHAADALVRLEPCAATTQPRQQWSVNASANLEGTADGSTLDGYCLNVQTPGAAGSIVVLGSAADGTCLGGYDTRQTFLPEAGVGPGAAGPATNQLVDTGQFGRCLDIPGQDVTAPYLIAWPCQQAPDPQAVPVGQRWALPVVDPQSATGTGMITTDPAAGRYCLRSPGSTAPGRYVTLAACPGGAPPADMTWTVAAETGSYATSYRITDGYGYCLAPTDPTATPPDLYPVGQQVSKIIVVACDGSTRLKWNAPANILQSSPLLDITEK